MMAYPCVIKVGDRTFVTTEAMGGMDLVAELVDRGNTTETLDYELQQTSAKEQIKTGRSKQPSTSPIPRSPDGQSSILWRSPVLAKILYIDGCT